MFAIDKTKVITGTKYIGRNHPISEIKPRLALSSVNCTQVITGAKITNFYCCQERLQEIQLLPQDSIPRFTASNDIRSMNHPH